MKIIKLFISLLLISTSLLSQQYNNWNIGNRAWLKFPGPTLLLNSMLSVTEGCASVSDDSGNLLFYTDGSRVYNRLHAIMPNGTGLFGGTGSSTAAAIILQQPLSSNIYYVFTVNQLGSLQQFSYSIVDINLNAGLGAVTIKNVVIHSPTSEKLTAIKHCNNVDWWVVTHDIGNNNYRVVLLSSTGVSASIVSSTGYTASNNSALGHIKANIQGNRIACAFYPFLVQLANFNPATGTVSNAVTVSSQNGGYGVEFSPNGKLLYITYNGGTRFDQYNLCTGTTFNLGATGLLTGSIQLHRDNGRIYFTRSSNGISTIFDPNNIGIGCNVVLNNITPLATTSFNFGLTQEHYNLDLVPDINIIRNVDCLTVNFSFVNNDCFNTNITSVLWNFGDGNTSTNSNPTHTYSVENNYMGTLTVTYNNCITKILPFTLTNSGVITGPIYKQ